MSISSAMNAKLNEQVTNEFAASHKYLAMMCRFEQQGLKFLAARFRQQMEEERGHALRLVRYLLDVGGTVSLRDMPAPKSDYPSVVAAIEAAAGHEREVTRQINELMALAEAEKDYATRGLLQWYVNEQVEEVASMDHLAHIARLAGDNLLQLEWYIRDAEPGVKPAEPEASE